MKIPFKLSEAEYGIVCTKKVEKQQNTTWSPSLQNLCISKKTSIEKMEVAPRSKPLTWFALLTLLTWLTLSFFSKIDISFWANFGCFLGMMYFWQKTLFVRFSIISARTRSVVRMGHFFLMARTHLPQRALNLKSCVLPICLQEPFRHL